MPRMAGRAQGEVVRGRGGGKKKKFRLDGLRAPQVGGGTGGKNRRLGSVPWRMKKKLSDEKGLQKSSAS